jgi:hypothetical protein
MSYDFSLVILIYFNRIWRTTSSPPIPHATARLDLLEDPDQDPNNDADFELPDQDALVDTFLAGLSKQRDIDVKGISVADAEAISVTDYSG